MSKKYKPKEPTGREYVDYTRKFCSITINRCMQLPQKWAPYLLNPLVGTAQEIEKNVVAANKIYINPKTLSNEELISAYSERIKVLQDTLRLFSVFDTAFDRLMSNVDVESYERSRLRQVIVSIINEEKKKDPNIKDINIHIYSKGTDMVYQTASGEKTTKLKLTSQNKKVWIESEKTAIEYIQGRIRSDKAALDAKRKLAS